MTDFLSALHTHKATYRIVVVVVVDVHGKHLRSCRDGQLT